MSGFWSMRRLMTGAILATTVAGATCLLAQTAPGGGTAIPPGGVMPDPNAPIAVINGRPINNKAFNDILMQVGGMKVFQQVFDLTLVQGACVNVGLPLTGDEFTKRLTDEYNRTLAGLSIKFDMPKTWPATTKSPAELEKEFETNMREQALNYVLRQQGVTAVEFRIGLETRANLRALAQKLAGVIVTPEEPKKAYDSEFGEKRRVHIFWLNDKQVDKDVRPILDANARLPEKDRKTWEDVAATAKFNPGPAAWTISANAEGEGVKEIRDAAWTLKNVAAISANTTVPQGKDKPELHAFIVLDEIILDTRMAHKYDEKEMTEKVKDFKESDWSNKYLANLRANAAVQINDPILQDQFKAIADAMKRQAEAAAGAQPTGTAPSSAAPATPATPATPTLPTGSGGLTPATRGR